ncbi:helix-turn-helix domain-containing protein [Sediminibacterium soli]|uniref:helix-turn-helix domain-containing protein n=1 Tax=Sediminibacterium soli TaxID=2698829 RepID=UPI00137B68AD|nr:helix-turn-helix transcriptional regulator [Sediminibacterium soli]NCI46710.1 helix-turn-helix transcriptional regulator [Sediminibacterium soli]
MTKLGLYLAQKSVNKAEVARKTGLTKARMNELTLNERSHLRAEELYLIALAIGVKPSELLDEFYGTTKLPDSGGKSKKAN